MNVDCRDGMHYAKNRGYKEIPLAILSRIPVQSYTLWIKDKPETQ